MPWLSGERAGLGGALPLRVLAGALGGAGFGVVPAVPAITGIVARLTAPLGSAVACVGRPEGPPAAIGRARGRSGVGARATAAGGRRAADGPAGYRCRAAGFVAGDGGSRRYAPTRKHTAPRKVPLLTSVRFTNSPVVGSVNDVIAEIMKKTDPT